MVLAFELRKSGYRPLILEARARPGGRNWSLRGGDTVAKPASTQRVTWDRDEHLYFNPGPARLPYHHEGILSYCRELGVPLEVMCNDNRGALMQDDQAFDGAPQLNRRVVNDVRGYVAELAAKAVDRTCWPSRSAPRTRNASARCCAASARWTGTWRITGSARAGWRSRPVAARRPARRSQPMDLRADPGVGLLAGSDAIRRDLPTMAATMLQPVGGMGRIGQAFGASAARHSSPTRRWYATSPHRHRRAHRLAARGTGARARDRRAVRRGHRAVSGAARHRCGFLAGRSRAAMAAVDYVPAGKVAFQSERRFWELDHADLWRHFLDQPGRDADLVSVGRHRSRARAFWSAPISGRKTSATRSPPKRPRSG